MAKRYKCYEDLERRVEAGELIKWRFSKSDAFMYMDASLKEKNIKEIVDEAKTLRYNKQPVEIEMWKYCSNTSIIQGATDDSRELGAWYNINDFAGSIERGKHRFSSSANETSAYKRQYFKSHNDGILKLIQYGDSEHPYVCLGSNELLEDGIELLGKNVIAEAWHHIFYDLVMSKDGKYKLQSVRKRNQKEPSSFISSKKLDDPKNIMLVIELLGTVILREDFHMRLHKAFKELDLDVMKKLMYDNRNNGVWLPFHLRSEENWNHVVNSLKEEYSIQLPKIKYEDFCFYHTRESLGKSMVEGLGIQTSNEYCF